jgi:capsid protein
MAKNKKPHKPSKFLKTSQLIVLKKKASGYDGAISSYHRVNRPFVTSFSLDEDSLIGAYEAERLRLESLDLFRNGIGKAVVDRFSTFVVSTGFNVQARTSNKEWNIKAEKRFNAWTKISDITKRRTWQETLQIIVRNRLLVGESFFILTSDGFLQAIEAERICSPEPASLFKDKKIVQGIELVDGICVAYYVCERGEYGNIDKTKYKRIEASNMIHVSSCFRTDAVRSLAELSPILDILRDKSEFTTSTIISAKLAARKSLLITSDADMSTTLPARDTDNSSSSSWSVETRTKMVKITDGEIIYGAPGDKIEVPRQEIPGTTYPEFTKSILGEVAAILGISYSVLMLEIEKTDEVALRVASQTFAIWQQWLCEKFIERVWIWRIAVAIKRGEIPPAPLDDEGITEWYKIQILPPASPFVKDQVASDIQAFNLGSVSLTQIAKRKSMDVVDMLREKVDNIGTAIEFAEELNKKYKSQNIVWRDIITSSGLNASLASSQIEADQATLEKPEKLEKPKNPKKKKEE